MTDAPDPRLAMSERELQDAVNELAQYLGWRIHHASDSRRSHAGLPDLIAVHRVQGRVLFAELKTERGRLRTEQVAWLEDLKATPAECYLWRPGDWLSGSIEAVLR